MTKQPSAIEIKELIAQMVCEQSTGWEKLAALKQLQEARCFVADYVLEALESCEERLN